MLIASSHRLLLQESSSTLVVGSDEGLYIEPCHQVLNPAYLLLITHVNCTTPRLCLYSAKKGFKILPDV